MLLNSPTFNTLDNRFENTVSNPMAANTFAVGTNAITAATMSPQAARESSKMQ